MHTHIQSCVVIECLFRCCLATLDLKRREMLNKSRLLAREQKDNKWSSDVETYSSSLGGATFL